MPSLASDSWAGPGDRGDDKIMINQFDSRSICLEAMCPICPAKGLLTSSEQITVFNEVDVCKTSHFAETCTVLTCERLWSMLITLLTVGSASVIIN